MIAKSLPVMPKVEPPLSVYLLSLEFNKHATTLNLTGRSRVLCYQLPRIGVELERRSSLALKLTSGRRRILTPFRTDLMLLQVKVRSSREEFDDRSLVT